MSPSDFSEAVALIAHGILKMRYSDELPGGAPEDADGWFRKFIENEISESGVEKLTPEGLAALFERHYERGRFKAECLKGQRTTAP